MDLLEDAFGAGYSCTMKTWLFLCLTMALCQPSRAQQPPAAAGSTVSGKVQDRASGTLVPFVTVNVKDAAAKLVGGGISDDQGAFQLEGLPAGELTIEFRFMGYQTVSQPLRVGAAGGKLVVGTVVLQPDATQLAEVTVTGEKPGISLQLDKKVFEVGKDLLSQSGSANDVLNGVPSVAVDPAGGISLRGNPNVTVLINGRRSGLTQSNSLDQIPAAQIERVEVITNPSSRYDAAGTAGIINVVLKKNKTAGLGGQLRAVGGLPNDTRLNAGLTYKSGKFNVFANASLRLFDYLGRYRTNQITNLDSQPATLSQQQRENRHDDGRVFYVGADYFINERNTLTAAFLKNDTRDHDKTTLQYEYATSGGQPDSTLWRNGESWENRSYNQVEFNYTRLFAQAGRKYTVDVQYDFWNSDKDWTLATRRLYPGAGPVAGIRTSSVGGSRDLRVQTDWVQPLHHERATLDVGLKAESRQVTSDFRAEEQRGAEWTVFRSIDNNLQYDELIGSGYAQFGSKLNKLSYLLGLRAELTRITLADRVGEYNNQKNYTRLFPTLNLSYQLREGLTTQLNYSRRINRPSLWLLYPFNELTDLNAQDVGNPDLNPSYGNALEWGLLRNWAMLTLNPSVYVQRTTDFIQTYTYRDPTETFISTPVNLGRETRVGLELSVLYNPAKWLNVNAELNLFRFRQQGTYQEQDFGFSDQAVTGRLSTRLKLPAKFNVQVRYNVIGARNNAQQRTRAIQYADVALSKNLLQDRATLALDGTNLFDSNQIRTQTLGETYVFDQVSNRNAARYRLSFTYRFNLKEERAIRQARSSNRE